MIFSRPWVLLFLALPVILIYIEWAIKGYHLVLPFDFGRQKSGKYFRLLIGIFNMMPALLLAIAIMFAAGPGRLAQPSQQRVMSNILFCLDVSGSMTAEFDSAGNRFENAVKAIEKFTQYRQGDAFGLTYFGDEVLHWVPVTKDLSAISLSAGFLDPTNANRPQWLYGTAIGKALLACHSKLLESKTGDKMIILLTDGQSADLYEGRDRAIANKLSDDGIVVYVISVENQIYPEVQNIADITGGQAFAVNARDALDSVFLQIDKMQPGEFKPGPAVMVDYFEPLASAGLIISGLQLLAMLGLRYTPF